jgi:redox-sensitive bicupin YhaK (pirin superfamily)
VIEVRPGEARGRASFGWLDSRHSFSFGQYYDPRHMGFGPLRVLNEDRVAPGGGFAPHGHANMEILTFVLDGALEHRDSLGHGSVIRRGDVQRMSAGSGIRHSEYNASRVDPVHFLQVWIQPDVLNVAPDYQQLHFPDSERRGRLRLVASPDGAQGSLSIRQDARIHSALLDAGDSVGIELAPGRKAWVQVARGAVELNGTRLGEGDGAAAQAEATLSLRALQAAEVLVFDLR